jgi:hypothetical protein
MEIKFSLTREDFLAYNSYCLDKSSNAKRYQYIYYPILGLVTMYALSITHIFPKKMRCDKL